MTENGYNEEEMKMVKETHKIWDKSDVKVTATCIRVPIMRAHAESINLEFDRDISEQEVGALRTALPDSSCTKQRGTCLSYGGVYTNNWGRVSCWLLHYDECQTLAALLEQISSIK